MTIILISCNKKLKFLINKLADTINTDNHKVNKIKDNDIKSVSALLINKFWWDVKTRKIIVIVAEQIKIREFSERNIKKRLDFIIIF